jgi:hypothetical protein
LDFDRAIFVNASLGWADPLTPSWSTQIQLTRETGSKVTFRGEYAAVTEVEALDTCVLGRDITGLFAVVVDQPGNVVCLLSQRHRYAIELD